MKPLNEILGKAEYKPMTRLEEAYDEARKYNNQKFDPTHSVDCEKCLNKQYVAVVNTTVEQMFLKPCDCVKQREFNRNLELSGMKHLLEYRINDFVADWDYQQLMKKMAFDYCTKKSDTWLCYLGQSGCGKTHLISAVANHLMKQGEKVLYIAWSEFKKQVTDELLVSKTSKTLEQAKKAQCLVIDDFYKGKVSEFNEEIAYDLINYRYSNKLRTLISSEVMPKQFTGESEAVFGRIKERCKKNIMVIPKDSTKNYRLRMEESE